MINIWHDIEPNRISPEKFVACIEIPKGGKNKYELDKGTGMLILDRVLYTSTHYPANYGFIPRTYSSDGDPLDVLVLCQESIVPLTLVTCKPIGVITMIDDHEIDEKIIAIPTRDPSLSGYSEISQLPEHTFIEISHFFNVYKTLEKKEINVKDILGRAEAVAVIKNAMEHYIECFG